MVIPRINIKINMAGIAQSLARANVTVNNQPNDIFEIINTAQDPVTGAYYWDAVNYGRPAVSTAASSRASSRTIIKGGREVTNYQVKKLGFFADGAFRHPVSVRAVAPVHMRERVIPLIRNYYATQVSRLLKRNKVTLTEFRDMVMNIGGKEQVISGEFKIGEFQKSLTSVRGGSGKAPLLQQVMADTMDYAIGMLIKITPVLQDKYFSAGFTPRPGLLRDSYLWRMRGDTTTAGVNTLGRENIERVLEYARTGSRPTRFTPTGRSTGYANLAGKIKISMKEFQARGVDRGFKNKKYQLTKSWLNELRAKFANQNKHITGEFLHKKYFSQEAADKAAKKLQVAEQKIEKRINDLLVRQAKILRDKYGKK